MTMRIKYYRLGSSLALIRSNGLPSATNCGFLPILSRNRWPIAPGAVHQRARYLSSRIDHNHEPSPLSEKQPEIFYTALASALTPFIFVIEAPLTMSARTALALAALGTSSAAIELTTTNTFLRERRTTVFNPQFLQPTSRLFATWELPETFTADIEPGGQRSDGNAEIVAVTRDASGSLLGQWEIEWHETSGKLVGVVRKSGKIVQHFNVHEELLDKNS
ncbi:hypothetical protein FRC12_022816 [Ceratobasidium sp. 428]|nr:hypothetical protein FRC12_022816 [Ceratobasidium sp. 428]